MIGLIRIAVVLAVLFLALFGFFLRVEPYTWITPTAAVVWFGILFIGLVRGQNGVWRVLGGLGVALLLAATAGLATSGVVFWAQRQFRLLAVSLQGMPTQPNSVIAAVVSAMALGGLLFWVRLRLRSVYGASEVITGLIVVALQVDKPQVKSIESLLLALLTAGVYLVVRGLDNLHHGVYKEPDALIRVFRRLRPDGTL